MNLFSNIEIRDLQGLLFRVILHKRFSYKLTVEQPNEIFIVT